MATTMNHRRSNNPVELQLKRKLVQPYNNNKLKKLLLVGSVNLVVSGSTAVIRKVSFCLHNHWGLCKQLPFENISPVHQNLT